MNANQLKTLKKIKAHAEGSLYRINAKTADCYAFNFTEDGKDWEGGWDWSKSLVDRDVDYLLMLGTGEIKKIYEIKK